MWSWEFFVSKHLYLLEYFLYIAMFNTGKNDHLQWGCLGLNCITTTDLVSYFQALER